MKKITALLLLALLVIVPCFAACNDSAEDVSKNSEVSEVTGFPLEYHKFENARVTILAVATSRHTYGEMQFVPSDETDGNVINDVVAERNNYIEQQYGITIELISESYPNEKIDDMLATGLDTYDVIVGDVYNMMPKVTSGAFHKLNDLLLLENDWWDQNSIEFLSPAGDTYMVAGDALICDDIFTYLVLFNKDMYEDQGLVDKYGTMYDMVDEGEWTYDRLYTIAKEVSRPDPDGKWTNVNCTYGLLGDAYGSTMMVAGAGVSTVELTEDGFNLVVGSQKSIDVFQKVQQMMGDPAACCYVEQIPESWSGISSIFKNNRGLYYLTVANGIVTLRQSATEEEAVNFGVVPIPKFDKNQEDYYAGINAYQSEVITIPSTNKENLDVTVYALEAMAYYSKNPASGKSLKEAYYETVLKLQSVESDDDARMLDIVFGNRLYDLGGIYNWGGLIGVYSHCLRNNVGLASYWESIQGKVETEMDETLQAYEDMK
ncbi:MAG: extracellular solute-binding protein [Clostridia bacterium]|nr:extracellular solute-binding protein [Clostridia bacterium]